MKDPMINIILIFDLQMINKSLSNNYKSEGFGMQRFEDDLSRVSIELTKIFAESSGVSTQTLDLLEHSIEKLV
jgi:hypothetical protein